MCWNGLFLPLGEWFLGRFFHASRGLRQGDPLSLFLFLIVAEAFGALLPKAYMGGLMEGFRVGDERMLVSHLQFSDDTLIMCKDSESQVLYLKCIIHCFKAVSSLQVNLRKSMLFRVGKVENIERLASYLGCSVGILLTTYLRFPQGAQNKNIAVWHPVVSRIQERLAGWKGSFLSKGGRVVLMKSALSSLSMYFLSLLPIPASVEKKIKSFQKEFLWGNSTNQNGTHLIAWNDICKPKRLGGLGITRIRDINKALLSKWLWHFGKEPDSLWRQVIACKYGLSNEWASNSSSTPYGCSCWKAIIKGSDDLFNMV